MYVQKEMNLFGGGNNIILLNAARHLKATKIDREILSMKSHLFISTEISSPHV